MLFNSLVFIFAFLPATWFGYNALLSKRYINAGLGWLVLCSLFFYGWWNPAYVSLIFLSTVFNFTIGRLIIQLRHGKKAVLVFGICLNLILLGYYKYCNFFINTINSLLNSNFNLHHIILPLAISFFTFTQIAFLVDSYRNETYKYSFLHYFLFVTYFPHLIAGPIVHHKELMPQFASHKLGINSADVAIGLTIFSIGLFKKLILADSFSEDVALVYDASPLDLDFFKAWIATISYTLQLYFDFSGYSDMAIGLSLLFGIKLPVNFNSPYKATSIIDFWRRWHITLSQFLKNYLYIPLGGNRMGKTRRYANLWLTMLLGGIWHGAGINFMIWGALHGLYLIINHVWRNLRHLLGLTVVERFKKPLSILSCGLTFLAVMTGWVFFRAHNFESARVILETMSGMHGLNYSSHFVHDRIIWLTTVLVLVWVAPNTQQIFGKFQPALGFEPESIIKWWYFKMSWRTGFFASIVLFAALSHLFILAPSEFMYFNF